MAQFNISNSSLSRKSLVNNFIVAVVLRSSSGFDEPRLLNTSADLDFYGELEDRYLWENLLTSGVILAHRPIKGTSSSNRSTLRFNDNVNVPYNSPTYGFDYSTLIEPVNSIGSQFYDNSKAFGFVVTFDETNVVENNEYLIIPNKSGGSDILWFSDGSSNIPPISSTYVINSYRIEFDGRSFSDLMDDVKTNLEVAGYTVGVLGGVIKFSSEAFVDNVEFHRITDVIAGFTYNRVTIDADVNVSENYLSKFSDADKKLMFSSKILGPEGSNINITITSSIYDFFNLTVTYNNLTEFYQVKTDRSITGTGYKFIDDVVSDSQLISCVTYVPGFNLPSGTWNLSNSVTEVFDDQNYLDGLKELMEDEWYPDFLVIDKFLGSTQTPTLDAYAKSRHTQVLTQLTTEEVTETLFTDTDARMVWFTGSYEFKGRKYPNWYEFIIQFFAARYKSHLETNLVNFELPDDVVALADSKNINYIRLRGQNYTFDQLKPYQTIDPIIRFLLDRLARTFLNNFVAFEGTTESDSRKVADALIRSYDASVASTTSVDYKLARVGNELTISCRLSLPEIARDTYKLNLLIQYDNYA